MTQIQAYEDMSKEALIEHHLHTLQQHADDMDMLSKELAARPKACAWSNVHPDCAAASTAATTVNQGQSNEGMRKPHRQDPNQTGVGTWCAPGPDAEQVRTYILKFEDVDRGPAHFYDENEAYDAFAAAEARGWNCHLFAQLPRNRLTTAATVAAQAQWIEHCNITDIPDAVLTPSGLAIKSEQADTQEPIAWVSKKGLLRLKQGTVTNPISKDKDGAIPIYASPHTSRLEAEVDLMVTMLEEREWAEHCGQTPLGQRLEAVITRLHGELYRARQLVDKTPEMQGFQVDETDKTQDSFVTKPFTACNCPSGNGSLRWPCPVHPPESEQKVQQ